MGFCTATRAQCLALQPTSPVTWMTLFSSVLLLQVFCQVRLFPNASCWFARVRNLTNLDGIAHNCDGVGLGDMCGAEGAHGVAETYPYGTIAPLSKLTILF